jgi:hypothetical protein
MIIKWWAPDTMSWPHQILSRGHKLSSRAHKIIKLSERDTMSWQQVNKSYAQDKKVVLMRYFDVVMS